VSGLVTHEDVIDRSSVRSDTNSMSDDDLNSRKEAEHSTKQQPYSVVSDRRIQTIISTRSAVRGVGPSIPCGLLDERASAGAAARRADPIIDGFYSGWPAPTGGLIYAMRDIRLVICLPPESGIPRQRVLTPMCTAPVALAAGALLPAVFAPPVGPLAILCGPAS